MYYVYYTYGMCIVFSWHLAKNCCVVTMRSLFSKLRNFQSTLNLNLTY